MPRLVSTRRNRVATRRNYHGFTCLAHVDIIRHQVLQQRGQGVVHAVTTSTLTRLPLQV